MNKYHIWECGVYKASDIEANNIYAAVRAFANTEIIRLSGDPVLSTKNNVVRFIASNGSAREFSAYEIREDILNDTRTKTNSKERSKKETI